MFHFIRQYPRTAILALMLVVAGCGLDKTVTEPDVATQTTAQPDVIEKPGVQPSAVTSWNSPPYILSEARYTLNPSRSGTSTLTYNGQYMGDWNWATGGSDNGAFQKVSADYGGATGTVGFNRFEQGGWCKFFVSLVLYRCSYGIGNNNHLYLPSGYTYADTDPKYAGPGWVLQSTMPHTAIIDSPHYNPSGIQDGWWVIDSNWIGTTAIKDRYGKVVGYNYSYWVGRHFMSFDVLKSKGFKAWRPNLMRQY